MGQILLLSWIEISVTSDLFSILSQECPAMDHRENTMFPLHSKVNKKAKVNRKKWVDCLWFHPVISSAISVWFTWSFWGSLAQVYACWCSTMLRNRCSWNTFFHCRGIISANVCRSKAVIQDDMSRGVESRFCKDMCKYSQNNPSAKQPFPVTTRPFGYCHSSSFWGRLVIRSETHLLEIRSQHSVSLKTQTFTFCANPIKLWN